MGTAKGPCPNQTRPEHTTPTIPSPIRAHTLEVVLAVDGVHRAKNVAHDHEAELGPSWDLDGVVPEEVRNEGQRVRLAVLTIVEQDAPRTGKWSPRGKGGRGGGRHTDRVGGGGSRVHRGYRDVKDRGIKLSVPCSDTLRLRLKSTRPIFALKSLLENRGNGGI